MEEWLQKRVRLPGRLNIEDHFCQWGPAGNCAKYMHAKLFIREPKDMSAATG